MNNMRAVSVILVLIICHSISGCLSNSEKESNIEDEDLTPLRINHIQMKGTL